MAHRVKFINRANRPRGLEERGLFGVLGITRPKRILMFLGCLLAAGVCAFLPQELEPPARRALFILVFAALLWVTEAIQAFAVGILVIGLEVMLLGTRRGGATSSRDWEGFVAVLGHPLVWLFFGGFVLAAGLEKSRLDRFVAGRLIGRFGTRPSMVLLGVMVSTFVLSMLVSNTATAALMVALAGPIAAADRDGRFGPGLVLGIAFAANIGGMATLIGTPPNAIAVGALAAAPGGQDVTFLQWMAVGTPLAIVFLVAGWFALSRFYPASVATIDVDWGASAEPSPRWQVLVVALISCATVGLWMTSQWHGIPTAAVSFLPIVGLTMTGVLNQRDIRGLNYDVLFLLAGGLALGSVVTRTGLAAWMTDALPVAGLGTTALAMLFAVAGVTLSNIMSNTAAANVLIPLGMSAAGTQGAAVALPIAFACSAAMCLPVATPPNALAHATGLVGSRDFLRLGIPVAVITAPAAVLWVRFMGPLVGVG